MRRRYFTLAAINPGKTKQKHQENKKPVLETSITRKVGGTKEHMEGQIEIHWKVRNSVAS